MRRPSDTLASVLAWHASERGDAPWVLFEDRPGRVITISWRSALERARRTVSLLREHGVAAGDRVNVHLTNRPEFYDLWFAAALCGAVLVPTNPLLTPDELGYALSHARCRLSVTQDDLAPHVTDARVAAPGVETVLHVGPEWDRLMAEAGTSPVEHEPVATDVLAVLYTSGTTSRPKGVMVSHAAYLHAGEVVAQHVRLRPDDRQLVVLPLFHGNAQYYSSMSALVTGASVALAPRFSASRWSEQAELMGATVASLFAAPLRMILAAPESPADRRHRLRLVLFAQNITQAQLDRFETRFGCPLAQLYGMTETVAPPTINPLYGERRNMSIGRPTLAARVRVQDGQLLVGGEPGWTLMSGYLDDPEATADVLRDGWLYTGDGVRVDEAGFLHFVDRRKDLIKRAGENISTVEVEQVLDQHPAVFESAVVGLPDPMYDEIVAAFVVPAPGASLDAGQLIAWCAARLARFKVPTRVELVSELPRTPVGKIQKHLIRAGAQPSGEGAVGPRQPATGRSS